MRDDLSTLSVGIVSLPFLEPQVTCYPAMLLETLACDAFDGAHCTLVHGHSEFAHRFLRNDADFQRYRRLSREPYLGDLCLLPLLAGYSADVMAGRAEALCEAELDIGFADALLQAFDAYIETCADRLSACDVVGLTATHFQMVPSLILAHRLSGRGPRLVLGGYLSHETVARAPVADA